MSYKDSVSNVMRWWSKEEKDDLVKEFMDKKTVNEISESHKRTILSITSQGLKLAVDMLESKSIDEVVEIFGFREYKINEWKEKLERKKKLKEEKKKYDNKMLYDIIMEMKDEITELNRKIELLTYSEPEAEI